MLRDAAALLIILAARQLAGPHRQLTPETAAPLVGMAPRRLSAVCRRWARRGWLEHDSQPERGWLSAAGLQQAARVARERVRVGPAETPPAA